MAGFEASQVQSRVDALLASCLLWGSLKSRRVTTVAAGPIGIADRLLLARSVQGSSLVLDAGCRDGEPLASETLDDLAYWADVLHAWAADATLVVTIGTDDAEALAAIETNMPHTTFTRLVPRDDG